MDTTCDNILNNANTNYLPALNVIIVVIHALSIN